MSELQQSSSLTTKSDFSDLHLGTCKENGLQFWYVGEEKEFDDLMQEVFKNHAYNSILTKKDMVIVDAGAYIGDTAYLFHDFAKKIFAIEPDERAFEALNRNIKLHNLDKVVPINRALAEKTGTCRLYASGNNTTGACAIPFGANKLGWDVKTISFDDLCNEYQIDHIDLLKVDIEGSEYELFKSEGFMKMADRIDTIILEAHPFFIPPHHGGSNWEIPYILNKCGFITKVLHQEIVYHVRMIYSDGKTGLIPMVIFVAKKEWK